MGTFFTARSKTSISSASPPPLFQSWEILRVSSDELLAGEVARKLARVDPGCPPRAHPVEDSDQTTGERRVVLARHDRGVLAARRG